MNHRLSGTSLVTALGVGVCVVLVAGSAAAVPSVHSAISGSSIKNHSISGAKLKSNTITGKQVKESTLGTVPNASKVGGVSKSGFVPSKRLFTFTASMNKGEKEQTLGHYGPLTFHATCAADGTNTDGALIVTTSVNHVLITNGDDSDDLLTTATFTANFDDNAIPDYTSPVELAVIAPDHAFVLDGGDSDVVSVNTTNGNGDCFFAGHFTNDAG
jgi:hypothetical protein